MRVCHVIPSNRRQSGQADYDTLAQLWPPPKRNYQEWSRPKQLRVDADVMCVRQAHIGKPEPIVDEEQISPPILFANAGMMSDDKIPLRSIAEQRLGKGTEGDEKSKRRHNPQVSSSVFLENIDAAGAL